LSWKPTENENETLWLVHDNKNLSLKSVSHVIVVKKRMQYTNHTYNEMLRHTSC